jgi:TonB family protein
MRTIVSFFIFLFLFALSPLARAQDADNLDLPSVHLVSCKGQCANFVPVKPIDLQMPKFPSEQYGWSRVFSEGLARLLYTVGPDGKVHDIFVLSLIGPRDFADRSIEAVRTWTYQPATSDGKPVAQSVTRSFTYKRDPNDRRRVQTPLEVVQALKAFPVLAE